MLSKYLAHLATFKAIVHGKTADLSCKKHVLGEVEFRNNVSSHYNKSHTWDCQHGKTLILTELRLSRETSSLVSKDLVILDSGFTDFKTDNHPSASLTGRKYCLGHNWNPVSFNLPVTVLSPQLVSKFQHNLRKTTTLGFFFCVCVCVWLYINMYYRKNIIVRLTFVGNCDVSHSCITFSNAKFPSTSTSRGKDYLISKHVENTGLYATHLSKQQIWPFLRLIFQQV